MKRSTERILTTHTGSLPRPDDLADMLFARESGELADRGALEARVRSAVAEVVRKQAEVGVDVVNDGEMGKIGYSTYVKDRLSGFGDEATKRASLTAADMAEFPEFTQRAFMGRKAPPMKRPSCNGPIAYRNRDELERDLDNFKAALAGVNVAEGFLSAASPGVIAQFLGNTYYPTHEAYIAALADAMKVEYDAIHRAGFLLQVDCPDLAMSRHIQFAGASTAEFRKVAELHVEALNHALRDVPPERIRLHLCWGNYEGPHHHDIALGDIIDIVLKARPMAISYEASNPRHEHEFQVFRDSKTAGGQDSDSGRDRFDHQLHRASRGGRDAYPQPGERGRARERDRGHRLRICDLCGILARGAVDHVGQVPRDVRRREARLPRVVAQ